MYDVVVLSLLVALVVLLRRTVRQARRAWREAPRVKHVRREDRGVWVRTTQAKEG